MIKVLIVDDEVLMRVTLRSIIEWEKYGFEIVADCNSGYQALEYMENYAVDLLITDVKMPGISGLELLKRLVEENRAPVTIILSGYNEFDLVREAFRLGAVDYLIKGEMNEKSLLQILGGIRQKYFPGREETVVADDAQEKKQMIILRQVCTGWGFWRLMISRDRRCVFRMIWNSLWKNLCGNWLCRSQGSKSMGNGSEDVRDIMFFCIRLPDRSIIGKILLLY